MNKISIRFFDDREVRAIWDEGNSKWWYSVLDIVGVLNAQDDYAKNRNYWKYLKSKLKKDGVELVSVTNQFKLRAPDGKMRLTDVLDASGVIELAKNMPNNKASRFIEWFTYGEDTIDGKSAAWCRRQPPPASRLRPSPRRSRTTTAFAPIACPPR